MSLKAIRKVLSSSDGFKYNDRWAKSKRYPTTRPYTPLKLFTARPSYGEMIWRHCNFRISKQNSMVVLSFYKMKFPALFLRKTQFIKASYAKNGCFFKSYEWRCQGIKRRFEKPQHTRELIQKDSNRYFVENSENSQLNPNLSSKRVREWSSRSIRSRINMSKILDC